MSDQSLRKAPGPERSHDREPHPASGCLRDDRGAGWRWLKRRRRDISSKADTFAAALSSSAQQLLEPLICRCPAMPEHQDGSKPRGTPAAAERPLNVKPATALAWRNRRSYDRLSFTASLKPRPIISAS